jgi:ubiquinone/menaquinone biosynthesis C-methylase UbiE
VKRAAFERFAGYYDRAVGGLAVWREHCRSLADHLPADTRCILDIGTGPGLSAFALAEALPRAHVLGADFATGMIRRAARYRLRLDLRNVSLAQADALCLPLRDAALDAVTAHSFLYLVPRKAAALGEITRVLRPGGRAVFLEPRAEAPATPSLNSWLRSPHFSWIMTQWHCFGRWEGRFTEPGLRATLASAGLRVLSCEARLGGFGWLAVAERPA